MKIGILTQYYPPEMGAPQARLSDLARRLRVEGHDVCVLTAMPNYPAGRVFPGYCGVFRRESRDGIRIIRTCLWPSRGYGVFRRTASYFSFVLSSLIVGAVTLGRLDCLITESPPLFLGLTGFVLSRLKRAHWIFNVSDLWPESAVRLGVVHSGLLLRLAYRLEAFCYRNAWLVTGQSCEILADIARRFPGVPTYHLSNGVDTAVFSPEFRSEPSRRRLLGNEPGEVAVAIYAGLLGLAQGLDQLLRAAARMGKATDVAVVLVGDGPEREDLQRLHKTLGLDRVHFLGPFPREAIPSLLASADIAVVTLKTEIPGAVPSKIYEAMGAALPVVLVAGGEAAQIVREAGAGIVVAPGDVESLAAALAELGRDADRRRDMGRRGRQAAVSRFDRAAIARDFSRRLEGDVAC
jgi:glycosyltransferase involved in cell wall biosynthesis